MVHVTQFLIVANMKVENPFSLYSNVRTFRQNNKWKEIRIFREGYAQKRKTNQMSLNALLHLCYAQHFSGTSMPIIRSSRLYVCYYRLWCAMPSLLVVGGQVQGSRLCGRDEGCCMTVQSCNIPLSGRTPCCPAPDSRQPVTKHCTPQAVITHI